MYITCKRMELSKAIEMAFNEKNPQLHLMCFTPDAIGENLSKREVEFQGHHELFDLINNLFRVNPDLKCKIDGIVDHPPFLSFHMSLWDFICGATLNTVWNCKIEGGKIKHLWCTK